MIAKRPNRMVSALGLLLGALIVPALVPDEALAQMQLFPNATIKRKRVDCAMEEPIYGLYRKQYYGYYPTAWRQFPPGWHLVSPEAVSETDRQAASKEILENAKKEAEAMGAGPDDGTRPDVGDNPAPPDGNAPNDTQPGTVPTLPGDTESPFNINPKPPADTTAPPAGDTSPTAPAPDDAAPNPRLSNNRPAPSEVPDVPGLPDLAPAAEADDVTPPPIPPIESGTAPEAGLAPGTPDPTLGAMPAPVAGPVGVPLGGDPNAPGYRAKAPTRRPSLIGGMFDSLRGRRRR